MRNRRWLVPLLVVMAVVVLACPALVWAGLPTIRWFFGLDSLAQQYQLVPRRVFMLSPDEGWIVGEQEGPYRLDEPKFHVSLGQPWNRIVTTSTASKTSTVALHRHNGKWSPVPATGLEDVSGVADNDVWAVGSGLYHWDGVTWTPVPTEQTTNPELWRIKMVSANEGWAAGDSLWHYIGGQWVDARNLVETPTDPNYASLGGSPRFVSFSSSSPNDVWAIESHYIWHYDGKRWSLVPTFAIDINASVMLSQIWMTSPSEGWIVGTRSTGSDGDGTSHTRGIFLHYTNEIWNIVQVPPVEQLAQNEDIDLNDLVMTSPTDGWAVGSQSFTFPNGNVTDVVDYDYALHYLDGQWGQVSVPQGEGAIFSISMGSADEGWAITGAETLHYTAGKWSVGLG